MRDQNQIRGGKIKAARALLGWDIRYLSSLSDVSMGAISMLEHGAALQKRTHTKIMNAFARAGIRFLDNGVVVDKPQSVRAPIATVENSAAA